MTAEEKTRLVTAGIDVDTALARFVNNEMLFLTFLKKFPNEEHYAGIKPALDAKDYDEAYKGVHAIKGVAGNLGINPVFEIVDKMCALMKQPATSSNFDADIMAMYEAFDQAFHAASDVINSIS